MAARRKTPPACPDCESTLDRRDFVKAASATALTVGGLGWLASAGHVHAAPTSQSAAETNVGRLYESLTDQQKQMICFPFDDPLRKRISANWHITKPTIDDKFYSDDQRKLINDIFRGVTSEDGYERFMKQLDDDSGGFGAYSIAIFGQPGTGKFEWEMTGRHLTIRADGDSVEGMAFGGPIVYGHGESDPNHNLFHYQTKRANDVFKALDPKQAEQALLAKAPAESAVPIQGAQGKFPGIAVGDLSSDQQELVEEVVKVILAPYRQEDIDEALATLKESGGLKALHMAYYQTGDLNDDKVWDVWRVEGPSFVWHFRGAPHVHAYVHIGKPA
ncbi:MAG: DUF3500 domain-containing protein [Pirellulaceae bacterium]|nr:DUF3500 domain-containing protein [Pirellulaceae bacterium]